MKIPSCFYGVKQEVKRECAKVARKILKGETLVDAVAGYEMIDTGKVPESCIMVAHPYGITDKNPHFYTSLVADTLERKFEDDDYSTKEGRSYLKQDGEKKYNSNFRENAVAQILEHDWSIIGLSYSHTTDWFRISSLKEYDFRHRCQPYLQKLCEFWDVLAGEGNRYTMGFFFTTFWGVNKSLHELLQQMGVPKEELFLTGQFGDPEPGATMDLRKLCDKHGLLTMDIYNDSSIPEYPA